MVATFVPALLPRNDPSYRLVPALSRCHSPAIPTASRATRAEPTQSRPLAAMKILRSRASIAAQRLPSGHLTARQASRARHGEEKTQL